MSLLAGLGLIIFPCGIALGGQIYAHSGYYAVYAASFIFNVLGIIYIYFVPESITRSNDESTAEYVFISISIKLYMILSLPYETSRKFWNLIMLIFIRSFLGKRNLLSN